MIEVGASATVVFTCDPETTAVALGSGDVPVLGTPKVAAIVEEAAVAALAGSLDERRTTVGTMIHIDHLAPTAVGDTVAATATVMHVEGRVVDFAVTVVEGSITVATGNHTRVVVDRERFLASVDR